jgi:peptide-methionine (S)-S-oxide reductase
MWSFLMSEKKLTLPTKDEALPGRATQMPVSKQHTVLKTSLTETPAGAEALVVALGCFWGAERKFWQAPGVITTAVGYAGGQTPNPTYEEVCSGKTGHTEVVRVVYDPTKTSTEQLVQLFFESHDPVTTEIRPMSDVGDFYYAEDYHQQYLDKNPNGYCGLGGTGVSCPIGTGVKAA